MKKLILFLSLFTFMVVSCTVAPNTAKKNKTSASSGEKTTQIVKKTAVVSLSLDRPKTVTAKDITSTKAILKAVATGRMKSSDANKKLEKIATKVGNLGLVWIIQNIP